MTRRRFKREVHCCDELPSMSLSRRQCVHVYSLVFDTDIDRDDRVVLTLTFVPETAAGAFLIWCLLQNHFRMACLHRAVNLTSNALLLCHGLGLCGSIAPGGGGGVDAGWTGNIVRRVVTRVGTTAFITMFLIGSVPTHC